MITVKNYSSTGLLLCRHNQLFSLRHYSYHYTQCSNSCLNDICFEGKNALFGKCWVVGKQGEFLLLRHIWRGENLHKMYHLLTEPRPEQTNQLGICRYQLEVLIEGWSHHSRFYRGISTTWVVWRTVCLPHVSTQPTYRRYFDCLENHWVSLSQNTSLPTRENLTSTVVILF